MTERKRSQELGRKFYLGKPCRKVGHRLRYTASKSCVRCASEFRELNRETQRSYDKQRYQENPERLVAWREGMRQRRASDPSYDQERREFNSFHNRNYRRRYPAKAAKATADYRAAKAQRTPSWLTEDDHWIMEEIYELSYMRSKATSIQHHVDHIIPLRGELVSGLHVPENLQVMEGIENSRKNNRMKV